MSNYGSVANPHAVSSDLKIFWGKYSDIKELKANKKIVYKKWYLAYDTGEFFIGGPTQQLYKFGGSNGSLSKAEIEAVIENYTAADLNVLKKQLVDIIGYYDNTKSQIATLRSDMTTALDELNNETKQHIIEQIDLVMSDITNFTYSRDKIDKLNAETNALVTANTASITALQTSLTNITNDSANKIYYKTGNELATAVAANKSLVAMCTVDSDAVDTYDDPVYQRGHTYVVKYGVSSDITPEGGTGSYATPVITLEFSKTPILEIDSSLTGTQTFNYTVVNKSNLKAPLSLLDSTNSKTVASLTTILDSGTISASLTNLSNLAAGTYTFKLTGNDKKNTEITGKLDINVVAPIFYGVSSLAGLVETSDAASTISKMSKSLALTSIGEYKFVISSVGYLYFAVPTSIDFDINKITCNGFSVPFTTAGTTSISFGTHACDYTVYRSVNSIIETVTLSVAE